MHNTYFGNFINRSKETFFLALVFFLTFSHSFSQTLKSLADAKGIYIGNIMSNNLLDNNNHDGGKPDQILTEEFNTTVLENYMKMYAILPNRPSNPFNFGVEALRKGPIDRFIKYCKVDNNLRTRGHTMIWHSQAPDWLNSQAPGWTKQQVYDFTYHFIKALATYCGENMDEWDVINEVIAPNHFDAGKRTGGFRGNTWFRKAGSTEAELDEYFKFCFETAREFAPHAKLYYNDFSMERYSTNSSQKNARMRAFAARMVANGTKIDGIGFQSHFDISYMASGNNANMGTINSIKTTMEELADLGLEVAVTELEIRRCNGNAGSDAGHKAAYKEYAKMALSQPNCNTFVIWGISDKDSWITLGHKPGCGRPLLYDNSFNQKSAYFGVREALQEVTGGGIERDVVNSVSAPDVVKQGQLVSLTVNYETSTNRDLIVMFQLDTSPWTLLEQVTTLLPKGLGSIDIEITIPSDAPVANDAYQFQTFIAPVGGGWDNKLDFFEIKDIDVLELEVKAPYSGVPATIPGVLEMENYDKGGAGVSYLDGTPDNRGALESNFRVNDAVDIGTGNGSNIVGWTTTGEWFEHTVNVSEAGNYNMNVIYSSKNGGGILGIEMNGTEMSSGMLIPATGDWDVYNSFTELVSLPEGEHVLRFKIEMGGFNLDKIEFSEASVTNTEESIDIDSLQVFPNPSIHGIFNLSSSQKYAVYDLNGNIVIEGASKTVNLSGMTKNVYFLNVGSRWIKLVK